MINIQVYCRKLCIFI